MARAREPEESEQPALPARPGEEERLSPTYRTVYTLDDLPALFAQWRQQEPSAKEIARRTRLFDRAARLRAELAETNIPVDELLRRAREELTGG